MIPEAAVRGWNSPPNVYRALAGLPEAQERSQVIPEAAVEAPESAVILAAKHKLARMGGRGWDDLTPEERESLMSIARDQISSGPLLIKAKYLAKIGATAWNQLYPEPAK